MSLQSEYEDASFRAYSRGREAMDDPEGEPEEPDYTTERTIWGDDGRPIK